jgi:hypothetical protein
MAALRKRCVAGIKVAEIIFVQTRHWYGSYQDYWKLVELSGFPSIYDDQMDLDDPNHCYIITWFCAQVDRFAGAKARVICWNLEWANDPILPGVEYWSPDAAYAAQNGWKYVPVGSDRRLKLSGDDAERGEMFDVALMMYRDVNRRRTAILRLHESRLTIAPNEWAEARDYYMRQSRCMVHIHQLDHISAVSPLRFALAAAYAMPIISEELSNPGLFSSVIIESSYDAMADTVHDWLLPTRRVALQYYGSRLQMLLCQDYTFKDAVHRNV